jgi:biopolymer transport protein ExbD
MNSRNCEVQQGDAHMKSAAAVCLILLIACAGCSNTQQPTEFLVEVVNPSSAAIIVSGHKVSVKELAELLKEYKDSLPTNTKPTVIVRADPEMSYNEAVVPMWACGKSDIEHLTINDFPIRIPSDLPKSSIMVELIDKGTKGEDIEINVNHGHAFDMNVNTLRRELSEIRASGIAPGTAVLLKPYAAVRFKYVIQAANTAMDAGFANVHFLVATE